MIKIPFISLALGSWLLAQGCVLHDTDCVTNSDCTSGRVCSSGACVGSDGPGSDGPGSDGPVTSSFGGSGQAGGPKGGSGSISAGSPPTGEGGSSPGPTGACTSSSPSSCVGTTSINTCVNMRYRVSTCADYFGEVGFSSNSCSNGQCNVGGPLDPQCLTGANVLCTCGSGCTDEELINIYIGCYLDDPAGSQTMMHCLAGYVSGNMVDCAAAAVCLPSEG